MSAAALFIRGTHSPSCVSALAGWLAGSAGRHCVSGDLTRFLLFPRRGVFTFAAAFLFFGAARRRPRTFGIVAKFDHGNTTSPVVESPSDSDS